MHFKKTKQQKQICGCESKTVLLFCGDEQKITEKMHVDVME